MTASYLLSNDPNTRPAMAKLLFFPASKMMGTQNLAAINIVSKPAAERQDWYFHEVKLLELRLKRLGCDPIEIPIHVRAYANGVFAYLVEAGVIVDQSDEALEL